MNKCLDLEYDVALSFAGEDRKYVEKVANFLRKSGVKVFYDMYEDTNLWGKDLYQHLDDIYQNKAKYTILFISENYSKKIWTNHELKSAQTRAFSENNEYILPARFDNTEIPGIRKTIGYVSLQDLSPVQFAKKIIKKLGGIEPVNFLPDDVKYIKQIIHSIFKDFDDDEIESHVYYVFNKLKMTTDRERKFLTFLVMHSCRHDITGDLHEDIRLLERVSGFTKDEIIDILKNLTILGFEYKISKSIEGSEEESNQLEIEMLHLSLIARDPDLSLVDLTMILTFMYFAPMNLRCETCCFDALKRLDFTDLKNDITESDLYDIISYLPNESEGDEDNYIEIENPDGENIC
ncbi:TIR domain-containing protein [uncultured Flavobacterium sp.]|uniref:toll/interleukin-1 receptor domain-containing protein n=1 Tax=uncultured Flavobacterium sp. TaxID=165435 RepID=UPI00292F69DD|nr:TIR domain-containing protein [uncultured Flavobacterium sp.]